MNIWRAVYVMDIELIFIADGLIDNQHWKSSGVFLYCFGKKINLRGEKQMKSLIRLRMSSHDAHYGGNLVDGARMLQLFGDVATELLIKNDGDEGLFKAYDSVEFMAPVYAGDFIEASGEIIKTGNSSRKMVFEARKVIVPRTDINDSAADVLEEPIVVCRASGTCVVPKDKQRNL